ncbi:hypothetical protein VN97_g8949 [Penicillium thymicola]|uniref:Uncharacterized protein n=1 Tax=Penicillium thymicola TaxID=293382 RepID=A0AAI9TC46_PENTH|nr:hypothetical protein VN97_g8949 [Penicillium thymicola]
MANIFRRLLRSIIMSRREAAALAQIEELSRAIDASCKFQIELHLWLAEHNFILAHSTSSNPTLGIPPFQSDSHSLSDIPRTISPTGITPTSINGIWLCAYSGSLLVDAEERWRRDEPELAMELASQVISQNPFLCELDEMRCRLFIAAVQHSLCQYEDSMTSLETVVQINTCYTVLNNPESSIIAGITQFIKGMNLMKYERFPEAYTSLTRALHIPGYSEKIREVQRQAVIGFTCIEAAEFDHSPEASTHALLDWEDSELVNTDSS